jgi:autotransporter-associated beta strand protein
VISGSGSLNKTGGNTLLLTTVNTYTGTTAVDAGALVLANNAALISAQPVNVASGAIFGGYGSVGGDVINDGLLAVADAAPGFTNGPAGQFSIGGQLINNGEIRMSSATPASILLVGGNYIGNNGLLTLSTTLGEDNSATDKLVVLGSTAGATRVAINNAGGMGAQTTNGIEIVQVGGASDGSFALQGRVVAGAYEYQLVQGTPNGNDGDWYLSSVANLGPTPPAPPTPPTPPAPPPPPPPPPPYRILVLPSAHSIESRLSDSLQTSDFPGIRYEPVAKLDGATFFIESHTSSPSPSGSGVSDGPRSE